MDKVEYENSLWTVKWHRATFTITEDMLWKEVIAQVTYKWQWKDPDLSFMLLEEV